MLSARADTDQGAWTAWIGEALKLHRDKTGMGDSGGARFSKIDVKLSNALNAMITSSGDSGREVGMQNKVMTLDLARRSPPKIVKARQIVAIILESFHGSTHTDLMFAGKHLYELNYPGDSKLNLFRNQWIHILSAMKEDHKPRDLAVRDILFDKIKGASSMAFDIRYYKQRPEGDTEKSYEFLMETMARTIATEREEKNRPEKSKGVHEIMGAKAFAVEKPPKKEDKPEANKPPKGNNETAAPVLVKPNPKKDGKGKDTGKGDKSRGRSPSQDRKSIPCIYLFRRAAIYHFQNGGCSKGKDCRFGHSQKKAPCGSSTGPGNGKGGNPKKDMQHPQRLDHERQRPLLKGSPKPRPPKPKVPQWS